MLGEVRWVNGTEADEQTGANQAAGRLAACLAFALGFMPPPARMRPAANQVQLLAPLPGQGFADSATIGPEFALELLEELARPFSRSADVPLEHRVAPRRTVGPQPAGLIIALPIRIEAMADAYVGSEVTRFKLEHTGRI